MDQTIGDLESNADCHKKKINEILLQLKRATEKTLNFITRNILAVTLLILTIIYFIETLIYSIIDL